MKEIVRFQNTYLYSKKFISSLNCSNIPVMNSNDNILYCTLLIGFWVQVIDKSFGFDTAVEEAQRAINAAHVEVESVENGVGIVKLMGRYSGM